MTAAGSTAWTASRRGLAILGASALVAAVAVAALLVWLPLPPVPPSEIVDHATFYGVDAARGRLPVAIAAVAWPALTLLAVLALRRLWRPREGGWSRPALTLEPPGRCRYDLAAGLTDAAVLGIATGLGSSIAFGVGAGAAAGVALAIAAALVVATGRDAEGLARVVSGLAPLGPALLAIASARTVVHVVETGAVHAYPWFPVWLAAVLAVPGWVLAFRIGAGRAARPVAMLWVGLPLVWLLTARLPGADGPLDLLREGEALAGAFAALDGRWPWATLSAIQGPWVDAGRALVGMTVLEPSRWGALAGQALLVRPLWLVAAAALFGWLSGWRWPHAALATVLAALMLGAGANPGLGPAADIRLILWPVALAALGLLLVRATPLRSLVLAVLAVSQVILAPASLAAPAALLAVVVLRDALTGEGRGWRRFRASLLCGSLIGLLAVLAVAAAGAIGDLRLLTPLRLGFDAAGPLVRGASLDGTLLANAPVAVLATVLALAAIVAVAGWAAVARRQPDPRDGVVVAAGLFALTALPGAAGGDAVGVLEVAAIPVAVSTVRLLAMVEAAVPTIRAVPHPAILAGLLAATATAAFSPRSGLAVDPEAVAARLRPTVVSDGARPRIGFARSDAIDPAVLDGWRLLLEGWVSPGGAVLDLTGRPALFHTLLGYRGVGRFLHGDLAVGRAEQDELAAELDRSAPEAVILPTGRDPDGIPGTVRHHRLTRAVLERYVPVEAFADGVLYVPRGTDLADPALHARAVACDWGDAPGRLVLDPPESGPKDWPSRVLSGPDTVTFSGSLSSAVGAPAADLVVVLLDGRPIADEAPEGDRFRITVQAPRGTGRRLRVAASMPAGGLRPISAGPGIEFEGGDTLGDIPGGEPAGMLDAREIVVHDGVLQLAPPPVGAAERAALRLEVVGGEPGRRYRIGDRPPWARQGSEAAIRFGSPDGGRAVVPLGACPQWWGYHQGPLYLWSEDGRPFDGLAVSRSVGRAAGARP